jgi:hypothetical protein
MFFDCLLFADGDMYPPWALGTWGAPCWDEGLDFIWYDGEAVAKSVK